MKVLEFVKCYRWFLVTIFSNFSVALYMSHQARMYEEDWFARLLAVILSGVTLWLTIRLFKTIAADRKAPSP